MPFLKFSRDKRGYEHIYLVHASNRRDKPSRNRVLYWFRTPPGVRVGRQPFDDHVRRALEAQNPNLTFDWEKLLATPIPPPDVDRWRDRRRAERAAKRTQADDDDESVSGEEAATEDQPSGDHPEFPAADASRGTVPPGPSAADLGGAVPLAQAEGAVVPSGDTSGQPGRRRRRRRRGGRRNRRPEGSAVAGAFHEPAVSGDAAADADSATPDLPEGK